MSSLWNIFWNWGDLLSFGGDAVTYGIMAAIGTFLFFLRLVFAMFGGDSGDFDVDVDAGTDASFTLFSLLSVMAFIMGTGWMGLACRVDWGFNRPTSAFLAVGFGVAMMFTASGLMYLTRRLNRNITYDLGTAVGKTARVYMKIPARGEGQGKVQVSVSGRLMTLDAVSAGGALDAFADVKVVATRDDQTLVVGPLES
jgi:hypothetical protein